MSKIRRLEEDLLRRKKVADLLAEGITQCSSRESAEVYERLVDVSTYLLGKTLEDLDEAYAKFKADFHKDIEGEP